MATNNTLYLRPLNGLCNRMRAIASALSLSTAADSRLIVFWEIDRDVGVRYEELFRPDSRFKIVNVAPHQTFRDAVLFLLYGEMERVYGVPVKWITRLVFRDRILRQVRPGQFGNAELERFVQSGPRVLISSWWAFYGNPEPGFSFFRPHPSEQAQIDQICGQFGAHTIGVHIRRTDNVNAIRYSPTHAFVAAMKDCIAADADVRFFLSTDSEEIESEMKCMFGERVITRSRNISRSSVEGMTDAIVDLFLLSRTSRILGSYYSTFSETAASIGGIEWVTVTDDKSLVGHCNSEVLLMSAEG
jgi:hypothetical protein